MPAFVYIGGRGLRRQTFDTVPVAAASARRAALVFTFRIEYPVGED
jgi:hypothetical protein